MTSHCFNDLKPIDIQGYDVWNIIEFKRRNRDESVMLKRTWRDHQLKKNGKEEQFSSMDSVNKNK